MDGLEKDPQLLNQAHFRITYNGPKPKNRMQLNAASLLLQAAYVTCLIAVWSFLIFEIVLCFQKYEQWPTYHNHTILQQKHAKFPDITFCTAGKHGLKAKVLLVKTGKFTKSDISRFVNLLLMLKILETWSLSRWLCWKAWQQRNYWLEEPNR